MQVARRPLARLAYGLGVSGLAAALLAALAGCGSGGEEAGRRKPLAVDTETVQVQPFSQTVEAMATLEADRLVQLASQVSGRVVQLLVRQGERVSAGQPVLVMDQAQLQAEVASLRAQMMTDRNTFERYDKLVREGAASAIQLDQYRQSAIASRQALLAREADLAFRTVRAPQAGVIGELSLKPGDVLQAGVPFTQVVSDQHLHAEVDLPANLASRLRVGLPVLLRAGGGSTAVIRTRIVALEPTVTSGSQLIMAQAPVPNANGLWRDGMRLQAKVELQRDNQLSVPFAAVTRLAGQSFVYVVDRSPQQSQGPASPVALQVPVRLGPLQQGRYPVLSGLQPGQRVITSGLLMLRNRLPIQPR
jgi:RND family efflux transporter MFP subunit